MRKLALVVLVTVCLAVAMLSCGDDDGMGPTLESTKIAFASTRDGNPEIYVMDADGSNPVRLTDNPTIDESPTWSPDGTQIAFLSWRDGNAEVYVMDADGSNPTNLTNSAAGEGVCGWSGSVQPIVSTLAKSLPLPTLTRRVWKQSLFVLFVRRR